MLSALGQALLPTLGQALLPTLGQALFKALGQALFKALGQALFKPHLEADYLTALLSLFLSNAPLNFHVFLKRQQRHLLLPPILVFVGLFHRNGKLAHKRIFPGFPRPNIV